MLFDDEELKETWDEILRTIVICLLIAGIPLTLIGLLMIFY